MLTLRELNRATLARQLLLARRRASALSVVERLAGMQAQWPSAPYVGLWTRIEGFRRQTLERALRRGDVVKATLMRSTLHLVTARDYGVFWSALRDVGSWVGSDAFARARQLAPVVRSAIATQFVTTHEGLAYLEREHGLLEEVERRRTWHAVRSHAHLLHAAETALWSAQPRALFAAVPEPEPIPVEEARAIVVRRYLAAFGPASRADIADWSGLRVADFVPALEALEPLRRFRDENGRELLDLPRAPLPPAEVPAPVRFLPKWDNVLLGYADRRRVLPEEYRKRVIAKNGDVAQTFLVDGFVSGIWTLQRGRVEVAPFAPLPRSAQRAVREEAAMIEDWVG